MLRINLIFFFFFFFFFFSKEPTQKEEKKKKKRIIQKVANVVANTYTVEQGPIPSLAVLHIKSKLCSTAKLPGDKATA